MPPPPRPPSSPSSIPAARIELKDYGPALQAVSADVDSGHFRTALSLRVAFRFLLQVAPVVFEPDGVASNFGDSPFLTLTCATPGALIYYAYVGAGEDPVSAASHLYAGTVHVPDGTNGAIQAIAVKDGVSSVVTSRDFRF
jgi:hypothetical protein